MARPSAEIIQRWTTEDFVEWSILAADSVYYITYQDRPINIRTQQPNINNTIKYKKVAYSNEGSCRAQVRRLNRLFQTTDFGYRQL